MNCEKASRRLRFLLNKAKRLGCTTVEVVELPSAKKLLSTRVTPASSTVWTVLAMIALIFGGCAILVLFCTPCIARSGT